MSSAISQATATANGVDFTYLECGSGPLAICLHGFPDTAHSWRHLLPALADAGFHAVAPFMRGYSPTSVPADGLYQSGILGDDANRLHEALGGHGDAVLIGHDWGAPGVYGAANAEPERWRRLVAMSVPPGASMALSFMGNTDQLKRSWYMFFFQSPLADLVVANNDMAFIDMIWNDWSPGYDGAEDAARVKAALGTPENLAAALGYYRATLGAGVRDSRLDEIQAMTSQIPPQPMRYLHGTKDGCIGSEVARLAQSMHPEIDYHFLDHVGHFMQLEDPATVNSLVIEWVTAR